MRDAQLTFMPGQPAPASGAFVLWSAHPSSRTAAERLGLPNGESTQFPAVMIDGDHARAIDIAGHRLPLLATVRRLASMASASDWPSWERPSDSVLFWSAATKIACELVAAGRIVPTLVSTGQDAALASWRSAAAHDERIDALAATAPPAAYALRTGSSSMWAARDLISAYFDAVADACARRGRRPRIDPRVRGPRTRFDRMWSAALHGVDPTVDHLRGDAETVAARCSAWSSIILERPNSSARLTLRLRPETDTDPWSIDFLVAFGTERLRWVSATELWSMPPQLDLDGELVRYPQRLFVRALADAARLYPPIGRSLDEREPTRLVITASEAAHLLREVETFANQGLAVDVPATLQDGAIPRLRLQLRVGQGTAPDRPAAPAAVLDWQAISGATFEAAVGDEAIDEATFADLVSRRQPMVRWRGRWVRVDDDVIAAADRVGGQLAITAIEALAAALAGQHHVDGLGWVETRRGPAIEQALRHLRDSARPDDAVLGSFDGTLRDYQHRGVAWLQALANVGMGAVLADEMGLGKTVQAIAMLTARPSDRPQLVVCPTSVVGNWERELRRFAPTFAVVRHHGPDRTLNRRTFVAGAVVVTSYALLRRDLQLLQSVDWDVVILDEAQQIKNPQAKTARAARALSRRMTVAMTGTPVENRLSELWAIVDVTNPGLLGPRRTYDERYAMPIERWHDHDATRRLRRLVAPFVLRRRKDDDDVSIDLPAKQHLAVSCVLTGEQASLYERVVDRAFGDDGLGTTTFERRGRILALLTALKQICNHPAQYLRDVDLAKQPRLGGRSGKLTRLVEILDEIVESDSHVLVFTQFKQMGLLLQHHLEQVYGFDDIPFLHGGVALNARETMVDQFQRQDGAPPIMLISLRAGGTGLNLTRANHVIHYDRWWNPAVEDQATDRAHRIGQTRNVSVHTMMATGTIEERIGDLLHAKRAVAESIVGGGEAWITELGDDELFELVSLSVGSPTDIDDVEDGHDEDDRPSINLIALPGGRS